MRLDYNDKKLGREKVERRTVQKNRPRKEPVGLFAILSVAVLVATFGAGVLTGWYFFKGEPAPPVVAAAPPVKQEAPAPPPAPPAADEPLTFYKTLPAGAVMGSGVNLKLEPAPVPVKPAPAPAPQAGQPQPPASQPQASLPQAPQPQAGKQEPQARQGQENQAAKDQPAAAKDQAARDQEESARYAVQVASYRDKEEAEAARAKFSAKGVAAYLVESRLADKSVWYRLRIGRNLTKAEAGQIAARAGKGAVLIPE